jgi:hypothetical protein
MVYGAGAVATMANPIKASGAIVQVKPDDLGKILAKTEAPLIIRAEA